MIRAIAVAALALLGACLDAPPRDLAELVVRDSTYVAPETMEPYSGRVFRAFADEPDKIQIEGALLDGTWHGDFTVYHSSGRVRYAGAFDRGERCGPWTENGDDREAESTYQMLMTEIETLAMYPPCVHD